MGEKKQQETPKVVADEPYVREDWTLFRSVPTISQLSGVPPEWLRRLVAKELADNAARCKWRLPGWHLTQWWILCRRRWPWHWWQSRRHREVVLLSSAANVLESEAAANAWALGNGLRVVAGAVFASTGSLRVITRGQIFELYPQESGETLVKARECRQREGTRIEVRLGDAIPEDVDFLQWAQTAMHCCGDQPIYSRKTSAWWYDSSSFFELLQAAGARSIREVMEGFDGCSGRASEIVKQFSGKIASSLTFDEAQELLRTARSSCTPPKPERLALLKTQLGGSYAKERGVLEMPPGRGEVPAKLQYSVEAWCNHSCDDEDYLTVLVNRTPVTGDTQINRCKEKTDVRIHGCNLGYRFKVGRKPVDLVINIQIPYMPITSNGKEPNLKLFVYEIRKTVEAAARKCQRANPSAKPVSQNAIILDNLAAAIGHASGSGAYRFSLRQLFYAVRPTLLECFDKEPGYDWFGKVIAAYENEHGDIPGLYRDDRGVLYHPHLRTTISLGTLSVEDYERPKWTFNKILYCEKEGFFTILQSANWPERHDCALLTSKGQATKAAKDLIDLLGETDENILFFVIADADAFGTVIIQALQEATRARPERKVKIINLGLHPEEGLQMGLAVEEIKEGKNRKPVGRHISPEWETWLQSRRIELNAMTTPQFIEWLDRKMSEHGQGKIIPPGQVMSDFLAESLQGRLETRIREKILAEADFPGQVQRAITTLQPEVARHAVDLPRHVEASLAVSPADSWRAPIERIAEELAK